MFEFLISQWNDYQNSNNNDCVYSCDTAIINTLQTHQHSGEDSMNRRFAEKLKCCRYNFNSIEEETVTISVA